MSPPAMLFAPEPAPVADAAAPPCAVLLCNLGTPAAPTAAALRPYLREFLGDVRVVEASRWWWKPLLYGLIAPLRAPQSARKYAAIWTSHGSPLLHGTRLQAAALQDWLHARGAPVPVACAMRYGAPAMAHALDALKARGAQRILMLPAYPQYATSTTASAVDALCQWAQRTRHLPELRIVSRYPDHPAYIAALAQQVRAHWQAHGRGQRLLLSFHGMPQRACALGDPYESECQRTAQALRQALGMDEVQCLLAFQSRFGKAHWLQPYTVPTLQQLAAQGVRHVDVMCPGFVADCLETLEEIRIVAKQRFMQAGGERFGYIACLNDHPQWIQALGELALQHMAGWLDAGR